MLTELFQQGPIYAKIIEQQSHTVDFTSPEAIAAAAGVGIITGVAMLAYRCTGGACRPENRLFTTNDDSESYNNL